MDRETLFQWILEQYGTEPEYLWADAPDAAVLRNLGRKWYGLVMTVHGDKLGLPEKGPVEVLNVKCPPILSGGLRTKPGILPAYHMSKTHWISILLDGTVDAEEIKSLLDISHQLTLPKPQKTRKTAKNTPKNSDSKEHSHD